MNDLFALISQHREDANVIAAISSAVAALVSFLVASLSLWVSYSTYKHQRNHDVMTLRPLVEVTVADWETTLRITLRNNGAGPLIVRQLVVGDGAEVRPSILDWMPALPEGIFWSTFSGNVDGRSISPDKAITLLELTGDDGELKFCDYRDEVRSALRGLTVNVEYMDVYNDWIKPYRKSLAWFGRRLEEEHVV